MARLTSSGFRGTPGVRRLRSPSSPGTCSGASQNVSHPHLSKISFVIVVIPFFLNPSRLWLSMRRMPETTRNSGVTLAARLAHAPPRLLYREILNCRCARGDAKPQTKLLVPVAVPRHRERCGIGHRCETGEGLVLRQTAIERVGGRIRNTPPKSGGDNNARELRWPHGIPWVISGLILMAAAGCSKRGHS